MINFRQAANCTADTESENTLNYFRNRVVTR